jgi:hypothetical protein
VEDEHVGAWIGGAVDGVGEGCLVDEVLDEGFDERFVDKLALAGCGVSCVVLFGLRGGGQTRS